MQNDGKLNLLKYLIFLRGKLQHLSIELLIEGQDTTKVDAAEQKLVTQINLLRSKVLDDWQGDAAEVLSELQELNTKAQDKIRQMRSAVNKVEKVTELVTILDKGIKLVAGLVV